MLARSRFVAAITRVSTISLFRRAYGLTLRSCNTRRSLTCIAGDISPISSRKIVPLFACFEESLAIRVRAGERAFHVTNNSDSSSVQ
jgi:hypothetical protein